MIGESYRRWAQDFLNDARRNTTASEHDKIMQEATKRLNTAYNHFEDVQRSITLKTHDIHSDPLTGTMLRNCYMLEGAVLFDLGKYKEAIEAIRTFRRCIRTSRSCSKHCTNRQLLAPARQARECSRGGEAGANRLDRLPSSSDFASTTILNRDEWKMLLANMSKW
jgi:hypothetical protein